MMTTEFSLSRYDVSPDCLSKLTTDQRAMFAILCLVLSEVEAFRKVLALGSMTPTGLDEVDHAAIGQRTVFFRLISMKLVEAFKTLMLDGSENKSDDEALRKFRDRIVKPEFQKIMKAPGYQEAIKQRKKMGFHFDLKHFRGLVDLPEVEVGHAVFIGADFQSFPYGEILIAAAYGVEEGAFNIASARKRIELHTKFIRKQIGGFSTVFDAFFSEFIEENAKISDGRLRVPNLLVAKRGKDPFPLFILDEDDS